MGLSDPPAAMATLTDTDAALEIVAPFRGRSTGRKRQERIPHRVDAPARTGGTVAGFADHSLQAFGAG